jgi:hypothetical protein
MVHFAVGREYRPEGDGLYLFGNIAPDFTDARAIKDVIHLRDRPDRLTALSELRDAIDIENGFELGWLLHLFADLRWDSELIPKFRDAYRGEGHWFPAYRDEISKLNNWMYQHVGWAREICGRAGAADVSESRELSRVLPLPLELGWYRNRVLSRPLTRRDAPQVFSGDMAQEFAAETARRFKEWL